MIKILHLYYDLLNLNGEQGNTLYLKYVLDKEKIKYKIDYLSIGDKISFSQYDLVYLGKGSKENLLLALEDIKRYKNDIKKYIEDNKYLIATGNVHELFGKYIKINDKLYEGLTIFDYYTEKSNTRLIGDILVKYNNLDYIIGFINTNRTIVNNKYPLFDVLKSNTNLDYEGIKYKNFYGTYLLGPLLVRNPHFFDNILLNLLKEKNIKYIINKDTNQYKAYDEYMSNFYKKVE